MITENDHISLRNYDGCWISPKGEVFVLRPDEAFDHAIERVFPEVNQKWEEEWEPEGLEFPEEALEYAYGKGWMTLLRKPQGVMLDATVKPSLEALDALRLTLVDDETVFVDGPGGKRSGPLTSREDVLRFLM